MLARACTAWLAAALLAAALVLVAFGTQSAAAQTETPSAAVVEVSDAAGASGLVVAQSELETDEEPGTTRRLVGRESSTRVDSFVVALWSIAVGMTVMLGLFLWHTSPRRRLRLARTRSAQLSENLDAPEVSNATPPEPAASDPALEPEPSAPVAEDKPTE